MGRPTDPEDSSLHTLVSITSTMSVSCVELLSLGQLLRRPRLIITYNPTAGTKTTVLPTSTTTNREPLPTLLSLPRRTVCPAGLGSLLSAEVPSSSRQSSASSVQRTARRALRLQ